MAYSRCGLTNTVYRGTKVSFVRHVNDLFMKYSFPLALFATVRIITDGVNAEFTVIPRSLFAFRHQFTFRLFGKDKTMIGRAPY